MRLKHAVAVGIVHTFHTFLSGAGQVSRDLENIRIPLENNRSLSTNQKAGKHAVVLHEPKWGTFVLQPLIYYYLYTASFYNL